MQKTASEYLDRMFPDNGIDVNDKVCDLPIEQKQMVEISCVAATQDLKVLILDEPTSSLTTNRIAQLHAAIGQLRTQGVTIIYITHKLEEIKRISTRVVVMKNGEVTWSGSTETTTTDQLVDLMGGKAAARIASSEAEQPQRDQLVRVSGLNTPELLWAKRSPALKSAPKLPMSAATGRMKVSSAFGASPTISLSPAWTS